MSVDFMGSACKESARTDRVFGLCDDELGDKAYSDVDDDTKWIAKIINNSRAAVSFTAIDNCITVLKSGTNDQESTCDGMLTFDDHLYLVELKNRRQGGWVAAARIQLENTIRLLQQYHDIKAVKFKKAYACNKKHPQFTVIDSAEKKAFFERTNGFRLDARAEIFIEIPS